MRRYLEITRCRSLSNPTGRVVLGAVTGAEPPVPITHRITRPLPQRNATEVGANAYHDQPLSALRAFFVKLRIAQVRHFGGSRLPNLRFSPVIDKDRFCSPCHRDALTGFDQSEIDIDGRPQCSHVVRWVHAVDERPSRGGRTYCKNRPCRDVEEIAPGRLPGKVPERPSKLPWERGRRSRRGGTRRNHLHLSHASPDSAGRSRKLPNLRDDARAGDAVVR